jgi:hypothetical protein
MPLPISSGFLSVPMQAVRLIILLTLPSIVWENIEFPRSSL